MRKGGQVCQKVRGPGLQGSTIDSGQRSTAGLSAEPRIAHVRYRTRPIVSEGQRFPCPAPLRL